MWIGLGVVLVVAAVPLVLGLVGDGWSAVLTSLPSAAWIPFCVAGMLFVSGQRRVACAIAAGMVALILLLDAVVLAAVLRGV